LNVVKTGSCLSIQKRTVHTVMNGG